MKKYLTRLAFFLAFVVQAISPAFATTYYVNSGDGAGRER